MKGILFIEHLFEEVVAGKKTQTRRLSKATGNPRYRVGEIVYLKEPFIETCEHDVIYKYNTQDLARKTLKFKNKLFMPAEHARHFIKITGVRHELLHDITEEDAIKEGFTAGGASGYHTDGRFDETDWSARDEFQNTWIAINGQESWDKNPMVWVYDFELVDFYKELNSQFMPEFP